MVTHTSKRAMAHESTSKHGPPPQWCRSRTPRERPRPGDLGTLGSPVRHSLEGAWAIGSEPNFGADGIAAMQRQQLRRGVLKNVTVAPRT
jgi:hypothetical protein